MSYSGTKTREKIYSLLCKEPMSIEQLMREVGVGYSSAYAHIITLTAESRVECINPSLNRSIPKKFRGILPEYTGVIRNASFSELERCWGHTHGYR